MPQSFVETPTLESDATNEPQVLTPAGAIRGVRIAHFTAQTFPKLFEDQAKHAPAKIAVTYEHESLTFAELNAQANQLARHLRSLGVGRETLVGICVDRSLKMAVGILGILKSGGAYLPLDPEYPKERLELMLDDARPMLVLTKATLVDRVDENGAGIVLLDDDWPEISRQSEMDLADGPQPKDLAYVIYTSGSTGQPKGVMIEHGNLANYLLALNHELKITCDDIYLHTASVAFSSARRQLMLPLSQGATVVIATSPQRKDPLALFEMIRHRGVTVMDAVPSFWRNCTTILASLDGESRSDLLDNKLRLVLSASEPLLSDIPKTWASEFQHPAHHVHMFGQTETAGIVSIYRVPAEISDMQAVPIGHPIANSELYILNEERQPCAPGVAGELHVGGAGVGRGYLNRPDLTAEKFIANPFSDQFGARLYCTGDWAKYGDDGQIKFVGRRDQQVKLRGFRVELGEVEAALAKHPAIRESVVVAREESNGTRVAPETEKRLIAYFVTDGTAPTVDDLRSFLLKQLPDYQVPSSYVQLDALPLSANGKVNRLALPDPAHTRPRLSAPYIAPRNEIEQRLAEIWSEVLQLDRVGVNDDFFELGGNSLQAAQVCARARNQFECEIPLRLIFDERTIALMSAAIRASEAAAPDFLIESCKQADYNVTAPLSFSQQQFWLLDQADPDTSVYNVCTAIKIGGSLKVAKLQQAFNALVTRHEILRTNFVVNEGSPVQVIAPSMQLMVNVADFSDLPASEREAEVEKSIAREAEKSFDLTNGPLLRVELLRLGKLEYVLIVTMHHIICDGWSIDVLLRELTQLYKASDCRTSLPPLPIQFSDFARWQRDRFQNEAVQRQVNYWKQQLANAPATLDLPTDYPRPALQTFNGAQEFVALPAPLTDSIKMLGRQEGTTLFMTLLAAFQTLLFRYSRQADIVVGSPIAGRMLPETENLIGAFVNTLAFRGDLSGNPSFREFLARVRATAVAAYANQEVPFEKLVAELRPERHANRTPLFQAMFALQNTAARKLEISGLSLRPLQLKRTNSKFDLTLQVEEETYGLRACLEYNTDLFAPTTMQAMLAHFQNLLEAIVTNPAQRLVELSFISEAERHQLLVEWNNTGSEFSSEACIHELFEAQVNKTPQSIAAEFQGEQITYHELNRRANQMAHFLRKQGVGADVLVGVCVKRSLEMLVSIFGVLKAGGAYVPLDPTYPRERIAFMIEDAALNLILTQEPFAQSIPAGARLIRINADARIIASECGDNPVADVRPRNLAYVIYTSGSTGNPKGVEVEHRSVVNFAEAAVSEYAVQPGDRFLQFASLCFDLSVEEIFSPLRCGATLVLRTDDMITSARGFLRQCAEWKVTILDLPTAYWHELVDALDREDLELPASIRQVIVGGEPALPERVALWKKLVSKSVRLLNSYGPTETTVAVATCDVSQQDERALRKNVPLGRPMRNAALYVLDEYRQPMPIGVPGELYIGGAGVARGYLNRQELTAEKFIPDTFTDIAGARLYKTGDLVRYRHDGNLEFLGRIDNQIKIRGFRVELEEIERALQAHPQIADVVVVSHEDKSGDKRLVAYVVPRSEMPASIELRNFLKAKLPSYMLPATFETIDTLPLMPNGKVDRRALPEPQSKSPEIGDGFVAPTDAIEVALAKAWCDALKLERVGVHDNFFELGGHSLLAARVVSSVRDELNIQFGMVDVLRSPTIAELAALLRERANPNDTESQLATLLQEIEQLSDEEAAEHLADEITRSEPGVESLRV